MYSQDIKYLPAACAQADKMLEIVTKKYGESYTWVGKAKDSSTISILFTNPTNGSWSFIVREGNGACMTSSGDASTMLSVPTKDVPKL